MQSRFTGEIEFRWFVATVTNINDPDKLGHVQIKIDGLHDKHDDDELPWAIPIMPLMSASLDECGISPTGIRVNSFVFGFFADGRDAKAPLILGTIPTIKDGDINKHDVSSLARGINKIQKSRLGPEPSSAYSAQYPFNKVTETERGHVVEFDDTPGAERIHVYHRSGTYVELRPDGSAVTKITNSNYHIVAGSEQVYVQGNVNIDVKGNAVIRSNGNMNIHSDNTLTLTAGRRLSVSAPKVDISKN